MFYWKWLISGPFSNSVACWSSSVFIDRSSALELVEIIDRRFEFRIWAVSYFLSNASDREQFSIFFWTRFRLNDFFKEAKIWRHWFLFFLTAPSFYCKEPFTTKISICCVFCTFLDFGFRRFLWFLNNLDRESSRNHSTRYCRIFRHLRDFKNIRSSRNGGFKTRYSDSWWIAEVDAGLCGHCSSTAARGLTRKLNTYSNNFPFN